MENLKNVKVAFGVEYCDLVCSSMVASVCMENKVTGERKIFIAQGEVIEHIVLEYSDWDITLIPYFGTEPLEIII